MTESSILMHGLFMSCRQQVTVGVGAFAAHTPLISHYR